MKSIQKSEEFMMLIKFGAKENIEKLQKGQIFMNRLHFFVDSEENNLDSEVGDNDEGRFVVENIPCMYQSNKEIRTSKSSTITHHFEFGERPVFCLFALDDRNLSSEIKEPYRNGKIYEFTTIQKTNLTAFGDTALVITDVNKFIARIHTFLQKERITPAYGKVSYNKGDVSSYISFLNNLKIHDVNAVFWKNLNYAHQQEFRFMFDIEVDSHYTAEIGDISDISYMESTEKLLNNQIKLYD